VRPSELGGPAVSPIHVTATYLSEGDPRATAYPYGRHANPTWEELERTLGELEHAHSLVFASGLAACFALLMSTTETRARVLFPHDGYFGVRRLAQMLARRGVEPVVLDLADVEQVERALRVTPSVIWAETPTNPFLRVLDLTQLARLAEQHGALLVVDNTTATAVLQQPLELGASASLYSLTKASSGHTDVLLGAVTTRDEALLRQLLDWRTNAGGIAGPFESWLALRGLCTLPLRIERQSRSAAEIVRHVSRHPRVRRAHYPGLDPATRAVAERQMRGGFGPLLSFEIDGDARAADRVIAAARVIRPATSFGGVESLWERRARWPGESAPEALIRLSVGIEDARDLIADIDQALSTLGP
jgi:cystathionine beta-lyase/cystathionine gamma-synthase